MTSPPKKQFVDGLSPNLLSMVLSSFFGVNNTPLPVICPFIERPSNRCSYYLSFDPDCAKEVIADLARLMLATFLSFASNILHLAFDRSRTILSHRLLPQYGNWLSQPNPDWKQGCHGNRLVPQVPFSLQPLRDWAPNIILALARL